MIRGGGNLRAAMPLVDLRQTSSRALEPLFEEEARHWRKELHWDYRGSLELIKRFVEAKTLAGCVYIEDGRPAGYSFYVVEDHKGLVGGLFVSPGLRQKEISERLIGELAATLRGLPKLERIEAQLMPFGCALDPVLEEEGFRLYPRQFMLVPLGSVRLQQATLQKPRGLRIERWTERHMEPSARLIQLAYADHIDSEINDQYRSEVGALKFLKNIILLPGCGQFQADASFVVRDPVSGHLVGMVLTSAVAAGVAHTTQVCVLPGYQRHGLGRLLMETSIAALRAKSFSELSLTVTSHNVPAVRLYDDLGFRTIKTFAAGVWEQGDR